MAKSKKTKKAGVAKPKHQKAKQYESHYLALFLVGFLLLESLLGSTTSIQDWKQGVAILDMSSSVAETTSNLTVAMQPIMDAIEGVDQFYSMATTEMTTLLDLSGSNTFEDLEQVADGVFVFYDQASEQMAQLLDVSGASSWPSRVAGVSVEAH